MDASKPDKSMVVRQLVSNHIAVWLKHPEKPGVTSLVRKVGYTRMPASPDLTNAD